MPSWIDRTLYPDREPAEQLETLADKAGSSWRPAGQVTSFDKSAFL
jgi:hypothetical protein